MEQAQQYGVMTARKDSSDWMAARTGTRQPTIAAMISRTLNICVKSLRAQ